MKRFIGVSSLIILLLMFSIYFFQQNPAISGFALKDSVLIYIQLQPEYANTENGKDILLGITLIQLKEREIRDVLISLSIKDENGVRYKVSSETIALQTRASLVSNFRVPENLDSKSFEIEVDVTDTETNEQLGFTSQRILISKGYQIKLGENWIIAILIIAGIIITLITLMIMIDHKKNSDEMSKYSYRQNKRGTR
ncbi:MAG: hypothetical protein AABW79_01375 [Nanoarchaeota archaeon]